MPGASSSPDKILNDVDKGDETQRRFRYQAACAALFALELLNNESEFEEIFLEQHEDILVRRKDKTFSGVQVKTRDVNLGPFSFGDGEIMESLERFIKIEKQFPGKFKSYVVCSNCGFWQKRKDESNLVYCLNLIKQKGEDEFSSLPKIDISKRIEKLASETECSSDFVLNVLQKVETQQTIDLDRYEPAVARAIANTNENIHQSYDRLNKAANALIDTMFRQSALPHDSPKTAYFALLEDPSSQKVKSIIQDKRITRQIVQNIITESLKPESPIKTLKTLKLSDLPKGMRVMELKMAKGGISAQNIDGAKDLKCSAETLLAEWLHKYGSKEVENRYQYLSVIIRNECQEAHDIAEKSNGIFGTDMLIESRKRLRLRHSAEISRQFNDCMYEHLLGIVGILTEECKLWWSEEFEADQEAKS